MPSYPEDRMKHMIRLGALLCSVAIAAAGCENKTDKIRKEAEAEAADHKRRASTFHDQISKRLEGDVTALAVALRDLPYKLGEDLRQHPAVTMAKGITAELESALSAMCVAADVVAPGADDGMSIGIDVVPQGAIGLRSCGDGIAWRCFGDYFESDGLVVKSCDFERDNSGVRKPGFMLDRRLDLPYGKLRLRITAAASSR